MLTDTKASGPDDAQRAAVLAVLSESGTAFREYCGSPDYALAELTDYLVRLPTLTDDDFTDEAASAVHGSALMMRFRGNNEHYHCRASACWEESRRRQIAAGHDERCNASLYQRAHNRVMRESGYGTDLPSVACNCAELRAEQ